MNYLGCVNMIKLRLFLTAIAVLFMFVPIAVAGGWIAGDVKHPARYTIDSKTWVNIKPGMSLPKSSWIHVGKRGHLSLKRGKETIDYKANTLAALIQKRGDVKTEIRQQIGSVTVDVQKRNRKHMTVQTPFLAAVVKGTKFVVTVGRKKAELRVIRGVVEVTDPVRGERTDVAKGQRVSIVANASKAMSVKGPGKKVAAVKVKKSKPVIAKAPSKKTQKQLAGKRKNKGILSESRKAFGLEKKVDAEATTASVSGEVSTTTGNSGGNGNSSNSNSSSNGNSSSSNSSSNGNSSNSNSGGNGNGNGNNGNGNNGNGNGNS